MLAPMPGAGMVATRLPAAFLVLFKGGFTWREQTFMAFSWVPKVCALPGTQASVFLCITMLFPKGVPTYFISLRSVYTGHEHCNCNCLALHTY